MGTVLGQAGGITSTTDIDWTLLVMGLAGGLTLFLLGMGRTTDALKALAGDRLRATLARFSTNRFTGMGTGALTTAIIQSSSVTTVVVVGFVSASLLSLTQAAPVIIGANLGTTVTAQVIALDITAYALGLLAAGAALAALARRDRLRLLGSATVGLGLVFLGMDVMSESMSPLGTYEPLLDRLGSSGAPVLALAAGALFTGLVQSSSATTGIVVVMAGEGLLDLETGIAIILGANIGTCVTAVLAGIGRGREAQRAAAVHVLVNLLGAVAWIILLAPLAAIVRELSPSATDLATPRQLASAHTVFNAVNTVVFLALLTPLVSLARRLVPDRLRDEPSPSALDPAAIATPVLALEGTRRELLGLGLHIREMVERSLVDTIDGSTTDLDRLAELDDEVDRRHAAVLAYLADVSRGPLDDEQRDELVGLLEVANELERLADVVETDLVAIGRRRLAAGLTVGPETRQQLEDLHTAALEALDGTLGALGERDADAAEMVIRSKAEFREQDRAADLHLASRLSEAGPQRVAAYTLEVELVESLRLVHRICRRIARAVQRSISPPRAS
ncbi:MAG TPA: Na/Pi cotransporter family protein [Acidimicrobiales bacterium]|nr:Na/Pi cotransporter family protein [Acidimicrobiales bacterium]